MTLIKGQNLLLFDSSLHPSSVSICKNIKKETGEGLIYLLFKPSPPLHEPTHAKCLNRGQDSNPGTSSWAAQDEQDAVLVGQGTLGPPFLSPPRSSRAGCWHQLCLQPHRRARGERQPCANPSRVGWRVEGRLAAASLLDGRERPVAPSCCGEQQPAGSEEFKTLYQSNEGIFAKIMYQEAGSKATIQAV